MDQPAETIPFRTCNQDRQDLSEKQVSSSYMKAGILLPIQIADTSPTRQDYPDRQRLRIARHHMQEALAQLDALSASPAAATLDMALHQLERELARPGAKPTGAT